ncbi:polyketide cyclase, partial [Burkholderia multivorans]
AAWGEASAAAGTPEPEARAAAERTTAFYLGED